VRHSPKGADEGGMAELTKGREEAAASAPRNTMRGGSGSTTSADERLREGEGRLWCSSKGEWGREGRGAAVSGGAF
jgi:hypothetical protein